MGRSLPQTPMFLAKTRAGDIVIAEAVLLLELCRKLRLLGVADAVLSCVMDDVSSPIGRRVSCCGSTSRESVRC